MDALPLFFSALTRGHASLWITRAVDFAHGRTRVTACGAVAQQIPKIEAAGELLKGISNDELRKASLALQYRAKSGEPLGDLLPEAFALVREAGTRALNMRHFEVQLLGGIALFHRSIAEMQTGEGKTLTATLPLYLFRSLAKACIWRRSTTTWPAAMPSG